MIETLTNLSLIPLDGLYNDDKMKVFLDGVWTHKFVEGDYLKSAFTWGQYFIIFTTFNTWETSPLCISLFDSKFNLIDSAYLGFLFAEEADFGLIEIEQPDCLLIKYSRYWRIKFLPRKRLCIPLVTEPFSVTRRQMFFCHFVVAEFKHEPMSAF